MAQCPHLINGKCGVTGNFLEPERIRKVCDKEWTWNPNYYRCGYFFEELWNQHLILDLRNQTVQGKFASLANLNSSETLDLMKTTYGGQVEKCDECKKHTPNLCHYHQFLFQKSTFLLQQVNGFSRGDPLKFGMREHGPYSDDLATLLTREKVLDGWVEGKDIKVMKLASEERAVATKLMTLYNKLAYDELEIFASRVYWKTFGDQLREPETRDLPVARLSYRLRKMTLLR